MLYYIGCTFAPINNWEDYVDIRAPRNYKDPAKIAAYVAERKQELAGGKAAISPMTGAIADVAIIKKLTPDTQTDKTWKDEVAQCKGPLSGAKALEFIQNDSGLITSPSALSKLVIVGCEMLEMVAIMAVEYIEANHMLPYNLQWLVNFHPSFKYNETPGFVDPARLLFGHDVDMRLAGARFGLPPPTTATDKAVLAVQLGRRLGL